MSEHETVLSLADVEVYFEKERSLWDIFSDPDLIRAVDGVSFDVHENDVIALVGESGCGKTTLGKTAIGIQQPTGGSVRFRGQDIWDAKFGSDDVTIPFSDIRKALQIIHQDPGSSLNPNRIILKSLSAPLKRWEDDLTREDRIERIHYMLELVGMAPAGDYAYRYPHQLSGGEKQRVALVRALLMNPEVILADEAISALDVSLRIEMMDLFLDLRDQFKTAFIAISHDLSNARYLAENADGYIGIMYLGKLVEFGPAADVLADPQHPYTESLKWATPDLSLGDDAGANPLRKIDIPDPVNPPSGCRFHTRCPHARDVCRAVAPEETRVASDHTTLCFRNEDTHEYWDSPAIDAD